MTKKILMLLFAVVLTLAIAGQAFAQEQTNDQAQTKAEASSSDKWSNTVNLGPNVNSTAFDGAPALSRNAKTLYFFSERTDVPHYGKRDLYMITRTKLRD